MYKQHQQPADECVRMGQLSTVWLIRERGVQADVGQISVSGDWDRWKSFTCSDEQVENGNENVIIMRPYGG